MDENKNILNDNKEINQNTITEEDNSLKNLSDKFATKYNNEELNKFKDELLTYFTEKEKFFSNKIASYKNRIITSEKKYENLAKLIKLNYEEILNSQASLNNRLDKFNSYESFVAKTNDNITSHEIRINNLREDYTKTVQKYDKIYLDNLELPGYIGRCAKYKNCQLFFEDVINQINKFNNYKEKNSMDLKSYKEKLEYIIKTFRNLLNNNNDAQIKYINTLNEKNIKESKNMVDSLAERVMELRLENSKHSIELIKKTDEIKEQMDKIKEMKGELLNEFYNKIDDYKIETTNVVNSFNQFKNEYSTIRKKFLELAEFIKDTRFKKNLGVDIPKKEISDLYKNLIKKNKKSNKDNNVELLDDISKIEKMEFVPNNKNVDNNNTTINTNNSFLFNKEKINRRNKKYDTYNFTRNIFKGNFIELNLNNNQNNRKVNTEELKTNDYNIENKSEIINKNEINNEEMNISTNGKKIFLIKENYNSSRSTKNIYNNKILDSEKIQSMQKTYDNTEDFRNQINNYSINNEIIADKSKNKEILKINKIELNIPNKRNEKNIYKEKDNLSISDSCCSFCVNNTLAQTGTLSDKNINISTISLPLPLSNNINNVNCNKFVLNENENDNKIIKELAAELEQSTAKKMKKIVKNQENCVQNVEPKNLIENLNNNKENKINKEINEEINNETNLNDDNLKQVEEKNKQKISKGEQTKPLINEKLKSLIRQDIENDLENNYDDKKIENNIEKINIFSPLSHNTNLDKIINFNSDLETNTETINSKITTFNQKLSDMEIYMKNKFIEIIKQINDIKQQNSSKKQNLNRTVGYKSDKNIFNFFNNNENYSHNLSISKKEDIPYIGKYSVIKLQKPDYNSHHFPSDIDSLKKYEYLKDSFTVDNWNKNRDNKNDDISVVKQFIEKKINIKSNNRFTKEFYKKNMKGIFADKNFNFINNGIGIESYENSQTKIKNNSTNFKNDMKYIDLRVLMNRRIPKNSNSQKINILLSGETK